VKRREASPPRGSSAIEKGSGGSPAPGDSVASRTTASVSSRTSSAIVRVSRRTSASPSSTTNVCVRVAQPATRIAVSRAARETLALIARSR
jgi:hypothetical protein